MSGNPETGGRVGRALRAGVVFLLPLAAMIAVYAALGPWARELRGRVRVAEPHAWELAGFGIGRADGSHETPAAWWQRHTHPGLDVVGGAAYLAYAPVFVAAAAWWRFGRGWRRGTEAMTAMMALHLAGYVVYLAYPAAPPWYADRYGFGPAVEAAPPEAAGAARFDAAVGLPVFATYYRGNANVFGAIPSLHVGLTFLGALYAWRQRSLRVALIGLWVTTTWASVYLNHHYLVDGLCGMALAGAVFAATEAFARRRARAADAAKSQTR
jgi:hypothetical protein